MDWVCWYYTWVLGAWIRDIGTLLGYSVHRLGMLVLYLGTQCMHSGDWYSTGVLSAWIGYVGTILGYSVHAFGRLVLYWGTMVPTIKCWYYATVLYYPLVPSFDWVFPCNRVRQ
jgi:hypothetical protein